MPRFLVDEARVLYSTSHVSYFALRAAWLLPFAVCCLLLAACSFPGSVQPTVKIGLSAPFEGLYRDLGYEALHAVRLAVRERNESGGVGGSYLIELVALNDFNQVEEAVVQARKMAVDDDVLGVLGGWSPQTARSVAPEYERLGLAFLVPEPDVLEGVEAVPADPAFVDRFLALSGGAQPGPVAIWSYATANRLLDAIDEAVRTEGQPTRLGVQGALAANH